MAITERNCAFFVPSKTRVFRVERIIGAKVMHTQPMKISMPSKVTGHFGCLPNQDHWRISADSEKSTIFLAGLTIKINNAPVDWYRPIFHLTVHECPSGKFGPSHEFIEVLGRLQVERHDVVPTSAPVTISHCEAT